MAGPISNNNPALQAYLPPAAGQVDKLYRDLEDDLGKLLNQGVPEDMEGDLWSMLKRLQDGKPLRETDVARLGEMLEELVGRRATRDIATELAKTFIQLFANEQTAFKPMTVPSGDTYEPAILKANLTHVVENPTLPKL